MPDSDISRHIFSDTIPHSEQLRVGHSSEHLYTATTIPHTKTIMNPKQFRAFTAHIKENVIDIAYGAHHTLFLTQNGSVYSYGQNGSGQCGIHTNGKQIIKPQLIPINFKITEIAAGKLHSLFIDTKKRLLVCGYNYCGQLGINNNIEMNVEDDSSDSDSDSDSDFYFEDTSENLTKYEPTINEYFEERCIKFYKISCGLFHSICITMSGECYAFGHNGFGNLGNGNVSEWGEGEWMPYKLNIKQNIIDVSCGDNHNVLLTDKHQIITFGDNAENQCSNIVNDSQIISPIIVSKYNEFGTSDNCYVENIICCKNETFIVMDKYCFIE